MKHFRRVFSIFLLRNGFSTNLLGLHISNLIEYQPSACRQPNPCLSLKTIFKTSALFSLQWLMEKQIEKTDWKKFLNETLTKQFVLSCPLPLLFRFFASCLQHSPVLLLPGKMSPEILPLTNIQQVMGTYFCFATVQQQRQ